MKVNQGKTNDSLGLKRVRILDIRTVAGQNMYTVEDKDGKQYDKRSYEIKVVDQAWYLND